MSDFHFTVAAGSVVLESEEFVVLFYFSTDIKHRYTQIQIPSKVIQAAYILYCLIKSCSCIFLMQLPLQDIYPDTRMHSHIGWQLTFFWPPTPIVHLITVWERVGIMFAPLLHPIYLPQITPEQWDEAVAFTPLSRLHICHAVEGHKRRLVNMEVNWFYSFIM